MHVTGAVRMRLAERRRSGRRPARRAIAVQPRPRDLRPRERHLRPCARRAASSSCSGCRCAPRRACRERSRTARHFTSSGAPNGVATADRRSRRQARAEGVGRPPERANLGTRRGIHVEHRRRPPSRRRRRRRVARSRAHAAQHRRAHRRAASRHRRGAARHRGGAVGRHVRRGAGRRGHPHRGRAPALRARRTGRRHAAHRAQPQRPGGDRPAHVGAACLHRSAGRARRAAGGAGDAVRRSTAPHRCPGTRICSARRSCRSRITCSPTSRCSRATRCVSARRASRATSCRSAAARSPGSTLPLDRDRVAHELGFARIAANSMDAVADRDFAVEITAACALTMVHCSRLGEELVLWSSAEFGFASLPDSHATGSSLDAAEEERRRRRARARQQRTRHRRHRRPAHRAQGAAARRTTATSRRTRSRSSTRSTPPRPRSRMLTEVITVVHFDVDAMRRAASDPALQATDVAEHLVANGVPFREAHAHRRCGRGRGPSPPGARLPTSTSASGRRHRIDFDAERARPLRPRRGAAPPRCPRWSRAAVGHPPAHPCPLPGRPNTAGRRGRLISRANVS